jgi:hypothetical protein
MGNAGLTLDDSTASQHANGGVRAPIVELSVAAVSGTCYPNVTRHVTVLQYLMLVGACEVYRGKLG